MADICDQFSLISVLPLSTEQKKFRRFKQHSFQYDDDSSSCPNESPKLSRKRISSEFNPLKQSRQQLESIKEEQTRSREDMTRKKKIHLPPVPEAQHCVDLSSHKPVSMFSKTSTRYETGYTGFAGINNNNISPQNSLLPESRTSSQQRKQYVY